MHQPDLLDIFIAPLEKGRIDYMITGSVASTLYGEPRLTHDIDLVIMLLRPAIPVFISLFPETEFYVPPREVIQVELARDSFAHFNLIHHESGYKADMYPFTGDPLHIWAIKNRRRLSMNHDLQIWVAPPEYVIIRKLQYFKEGGSQKNLSDVKKMLDSSDLKIDYAIITEWIETRSLKKEWAKAQSFDENTKEGIE
jgi:hypothetical protein